MNQSMNRYKTIGITLLVMCLTAIGCAVACLCLPVPTMLKIKAVAVLLACAAALYYMFKGYSKNAAAAYKAYMGILFVAFQLTAVTVNVPKEAQAAILSFGGCLIAGLCLVLCAVENLGEKLSKGMVLTIAVVRILEFVFGLFVIFGSAQGGDVHIIALFLMAFAYAILALIAVPMTFAKYKDKTERGTK